MNSEYFPGILLFQQDNWVPLSRTPWGGSLISRIKKQGLSSSKVTVPERIGESWEVSTDSQFPSFVTLNNKKIFFHELLEQKEYAKLILGSRIFDVYGPHCPLLLKWIHSSEDLSVQVHPSNQSPLLGASECGKPESWLVLEVEENAMFYLGFREENQQKIESALCSSDPSAVLNCVHPRVGDWVAVPPGLVHALGPGVLVAEPQLVLPRRHGKTYRLSDWGRRYNAAGQRDDVHGSARELHVAAGLQSVNWQFPRGDALQKRMTRSLANESAWFRGNADNPFACKVFRREGVFELEHPFADQFMLVTLWSGNATLRAGNQEPVTLQVGQSAIVCAAAQRVQVELSNSSCDSNAETKFQPGFAAFALNNEIASNALNAI